MSGLASIGEIEGDHIWVEAGAKWSEVLAKTVPAGLAPPTLTDYIELSIGGTLSVGGVGGASFRTGSQGDNVAALEVVTGAGELVICSPSENRALFDAVRGGVGQCGIIARARLRLAPLMGETVRLVQVMFPNLDTLLAAQLEVAKRGKALYIDGQSMGGPQGQPMHILTLIPGEEDPAGLGGQVIADKQCTFMEFAHRLQEFVAMMTQMGVWDGPHPWCDLFLPEARTLDFAKEAIETFEAPPNGVLLTYVFKRSAIDVPMMALPDSEWFFLVDLLRNAPPDQVPAMLAENDRLCALGASMGAGIYPIGAMPAADWSALYPAWDKLMAAKRAYDPDGLMTPGQGPQAS